MGVQHWWILEDRLRGLCWPGQYLPFSQAAAAGRYGNRPGRARARMPGALAMGMGAWPGSLPRSRVVFRRSLDPLRTDSAPGLSRCVGSKQRVVWQLVLLLAESFAQAAKELREGLFAQYPGRNLHHGAVGEAARIVQRRPVRFAEHQGRGERRSLVLVHEGVGAAQVEFAGGCHFEQVGGQIVPVEGRLQDGQSRKQRLQVANPIPASLACDLVPVGLENLCEGEEAWFSHGCAVCRVTQRGALGSCCAFRLPASGLA